MFIVVAVSELVWQLYSDSVRELDPHRAVVIKLLQVVTGAVWKQHDDMAAHKFMRK